MIFFCLQTEMEGFLQHMRAIDVQGSGKTDRVNYDILLFTDRNRMFSLLMCKDYGRQAG